MIYLLHFVVVAGSMDIDGNRVPKGSQFSIRSDDPRASAWEKSPRMKLTGRELIGTADPAASAASHAHRLIDALALAVGEFSRAVAGLPDAEARALYAVWRDRNDEIASPLNDAIESLYQWGEETAAEAPSEPEAPAAPVAAPAPAGDEIPAPAPAGDGWDDLGDDFGAPPVAGPDRAALAALVADDEATLKAMHAAIEGSAIEVATTKRAQREAIAAWLAANPG